MKKRVKLFLVFAVAVLCFGKYRTSESQINRDLMQIETIIDNGLAHSE